MNTRTSLLGRAAGYAHLRGFGKRRAEDDRPSEDEPKGKRSRAAEDDEPEDDEPKGKSSRAEDDPPKDDEDVPKGKKSRRAADDDECEEDDEPKGKKSRADDEHDQDPDEDDSHLKGKRSRAAADDDEDEDDEMRGNSAVAQARRRENARCSAIFKAAGPDNVDLAASLAFETRMPRGEAIAVLRGQADRVPTRTDTASGRRARNPDLGTGGGDRPDKKSSLKAMQDAALAKAGITPIR
jgi:hypothetical protein